MNKVLFPQGTLVLADDKPAQKIAVSVCGGRRPAASWLKMTIDALPGTPELFAADRGLDYFFRSGLTADLAIGDGDSADPVLWQQFIQNGKAVEYPSQKNETDLQLLLKHLPVEKLWIFSGVFGGRMDHCYSALEAIGARALKEKKPVILADEQEIAVFVPAGIKVEFYPPQEETPVAISLLSFTEKSKVSIKGTKWKLDKKEITRADSYAVSNEISDSEQIREFPHVSFFCHEGMTIFYVAG